MRILSCFLCLMIISGLCYSTTFTLSDEALMLLDTHGYNEGSIVQAQNIEGPGVIFDIWYPGQGDSLYWQSSIDAGSGALTGIDISEFDYFALDFTLLSVNGKTDYSNGGGPVIAGAYIIAAYQPQTLEFDDEIHVVSKTPTSVKYNSILYKFNTTDRIGFVLNIPTWWYDDTHPSPWNQDVNTISVLIQAAEVAVVIPEPATLSILALGTILMGRTRKTRA